MNVIQEIKRINDRELEAGLTGTDASWHSKYKNSAWVYVGSIPYALTEGDILCFMSQWGEIEDINYVRDKDTGKPKGFAFVKYEDQRSTVLAVDNFNGIELVDRTLRVDHCEKYRLPKEVQDKEDQLEEDAKLLGKQHDSSSKFGPGHAYKDMEFASKYDIAKGQDLFQTEEQAKEQKKLMKKAQKKRKKEEKKTKKAEKKAKKKQRKDGADSGPDSRPAPAPASEGPPDGGGGGSSAPPHPTSGGFQGGGEGLPMPSWMGRMDPSAGAGGGRGGGAGARGPPGAGAGGGGRGRGYQGGRGGGYQAAAGGGRGPPKAAPGRLKDFEELARERDRTYGGMGRLR